MKQIQQLEGALVKPMLIKGIAGQAKHYLVQTGLPTHPEAKADVV
jgi:hypothetical protein